jgi:NDP-sugar pyrophosphorylase family protein
VGKGTIVKSGTYIEGNVIVGDNSIIGPRAYIRGSTCIGSNCHIGASVELKNSIVMDETNVPHHNYVGDSILGRRCNLGAGTKVANLRLDGRTITSYVKRQPVNTGRRKLGVIMGDDVKTGINASINVGTVIGEGSMIGLGATATGWIEPRSLIF